MHNISHPAVFTKDGICSLQLLYSLHKNKFKEMLNSLAGLYILTDYVNSPVRHFYMYIHSHTCNLHYIYI